MTNTAALELKIKESGLKKYFIAEKLGLSPFGLAKKINNENEFFGSEIEKLCKILKIDSLEERHSIFFVDTVDC